MKNGIYGIRLTSVVILILTTIYTNSLALEEKILVFPPATLGENPEVNSLAQRWEEIIAIYDLAVLNSDVIPAYHLVELWEGDTMAIDIMQIGPSIEWGQKLEVDRVILTEWHCEDEKILIRSQSVDPWEQDFISTAEGQTIPEVLRKLEPEKWLFGIVPNELIDGYQEPIFADGDKAVNNYILDRDLYPPDALIQKMGVYADVEVIIAANGTPLSVNLLKTVPSNYGFQRPLEQALWAVKYQPATLNNLPVNGIMKYRVKAGISR